MKRVLRYGMWETNSSSCHTVSVRGKGSPYYLHFDGIIETTIDEYGWSGDPCDEFNSKLSYALCMVLTTEYPDFHYWDENFTIDYDVLEKLDGYKAILAAINKHGKCEKIIINKNGYYYPYGCIDHQSYEGYKSLQDFLDDWNVDIERFLFDDNVIVLIRNDNE